MSEGKEMTNIIVIAVIAVLMIFGIVKSKEHLKGQGGCCGGGSSVKVPKKKLKKIIGTKTAIVEDMTCEHCKARVELAVNAIDGAAGKVDLMTKECVVSMERDVSDEEIRHAIEAAGYEVREIR